MKTINYFISLTLSITFMVGCVYKNEVSESETDFIEISNQQFETESMELGKIEKKYFENIIHCNGTIVPLPNGYAKINVPLAGIVKNIFCTNGDAVNMNQPLLEVTGNEVFEVQREFAEAAANYRRLKSEYERLLLLYNEKIIAEKDFIAADAEYKASAARYNGLKLKIEALGLKPSQIEAGEFYSSYFIKSPIKGYISNFSSTIGSHVEPQTELMEIINPDLLQLKLDVFASDIAKVKKGQNVRFKPVNGETHYSAILRSVGVAVDDATKSIACFATISNLQSPPFIVHSYVEGAIIIDVDSAFVVPASALIKSGNDTFVLVLKKRENEKLIFAKQPVQVGREFKDYFEIINDSISGTILTKGGYFIENR